MDGTIVFRADFHTHTIYSDGGLLPSELARRAVVKGHNAIAITDHADSSNFKEVIQNVIKIVDDWKDQIIVIPGVELTHVPPRLIPQLAKQAKSYGASIVVVHGESPVEPVAPGTNKAAVSCDNVDILAHPGFITIEEAKQAKDNQIFLELTSRKGHNLTNGYIAKIATEVEIPLLVNTDCHDIELLTYEEALMVAKGAGLSEIEAKDAVVKNARELVERAL